jgi:pilus assembly protein CpaB
LNRRAFVIALVIGMLGLFLLFLYQRRFEAEASGGDKIKLLTALKPIERGKPITEELLATREVPMAYVEDRAIKEVEKQRILGLRVGNTVQAGQTIMWTDLATAQEERRDLSSLITPGSRAVSIRTSREDSSIALIKPGDYVDVLGVMGENNRAAVILLQKVLVLASGLDTTPDAIDRDKASSILEREALLTLSLTLKEAQILALAADRGKISVALRNPEDPRTLERPGDVTGDMLTDPVRRPVTPHGVSRPTEIGAQ